VFLLLFSAFFLCFILLEFLLWRFLKERFSELLARLFQGPRRWLFLALLSWLHLAPWLFFLRGRYEQLLSEQGWRLLLQPSYILALSAAGLLLSLVLPLNLISLLYKLWRGIKPERSEPSKSWSLSRRRFLQAGTGGMALASTSLSAYGMLLGAEQLQIEHLRCIHPDLPPGFEGLKVLQISDLHVGSFMSERRLKSYLSLVEPLSPDLIVITGDIFNHDLEQLSSTAEALGRLKAPLGIYACLGNHDYWVDLGEMIPALEAVGVRVLRGEAISFEGLREGGERFALLGVDDLMGSLERSYEPLLESCLAQLPESVSFRLLLSHRPRIFPLAAAHGIQLTLAGHTHGGQLVLPLGEGRSLGAARLMTPYDRGPFERDGSLLYVNRGLGIAALPIRLNCPREISLFSLERGLDARWERFDREAGTRTGPLS